MTFEHWLNENYPNLNLSNLSGKKLDNLINEYERGSIVNFSYKDYKSNEHDIREFIKLYLEDDLDFNNLCDKVYEKMKSENGIYSYAGENPIVSNGGKLWVGNGDMEDWAMYESNLEWGEETGEYIKLAVESYLTSKGLNSMFSDSLKDLFEE